MLQAVPPQKGEATVNWYCYQKPCFLRCFSSPDLRGPLHKYIISSPGLIIHLFLSCSPASINCMPGCRHNSTDERWEVLLPLQNEFSKTQYLIYVTSLSPKMYPKQCVVCWIPALLTLRLFPKCAAGGEDCQAQTFFSFKYIIILWVSTCPCKVIDRADFLPSYENPAYEYVSTRTLKIIFYKKLNFLQILLDLISSGLRYWLNLEGKIGRFIILNNQQHKAFWPNQIQFFVFLSKKQTVR